MILSGIPPGPAEGGYRQPRREKMKKNLKKMLFSVYFLKSKDIYLCRAGEMLAIPNQSPTKSLPTPISGMGAKGFPPDPAEAKKGNKN